MGRIAISREDLRNKIYGCWMGKSIGGTLGAPFEGRQQVNDVTGYTNITPGEPLPNDDLDLQLVWLKAVQERGPLGVNNRVLGEYWLNFIPPHWNEYGISKANQRAGLVPPLSGEYRNEKWKHSNGAWIRSEIWACMAPGCPDIAIRYAYEDASVDHGGGEGTFAALFTAAVESAAFVVSDRDELIKIGLSKIPPDCRVARSVGIALDHHGKGKSWLEAREAVVKDSEDLGWFQAPANIAFTVIGWLYGEDDFGKSICIAVNCGDDTDCTAATLGAILGIIRGKAAIPQEWVDPIGERILTVAVDRGSFFPPQTISDLTDQVMLQVPLMLGAYRAPMEISDARTDISGVQDLALTDGTSAKTLWNRSPHAVSHDLVHTRVTLDYGKDPDIQAGKPFPLKVVLENLMPDHRHFDFIWHLPEGWSVLPTANSHAFLHHWPPREELTFEIVAENILSSTVHGILEIRAQGRPTVGLIPLLFFNAGT